MRYRVKFIVLALAALVVSPPETAHADDGLILAPSSDWRYREYDDRCRASRVFGEGEDRTTLWIEQGGERSNYNITVIGRPVRNLYGSGVHVQFGDEPEFVRSFIEAKSSSGRPVLRMYGVTTNQPQLDRGLELEAPTMGMSRDQASLIDRLRLRTALPEPLTLMTGPLADAYSFLNLCGAKLSVFLSEAGRPLSDEASPPVPIDQDRWLRKTDYPAYLVRAEMQGQIGIRLTVDVEGRASQCYVVETNKPQLFDDPLCLALLKRARFEPARNLEGEATPSYYFYGVNFVIR